MDSSCRNRVSLIAAVAVAVAIGANAAEPIKWVGGDWDERGAPQGKLLTDNAGWWGERVWTGVTYDYEVKPNSCVDCLGGDAKTFGRRLLDGRVNGTWHVPVGMSGKPLVAIFDFKRPCAFSEVTLYAGRTPNHTGTVSFSDDGGTWGGEVAFDGTNAIERIFVDAARKGRYMRLEFRAKRGVAYLDEVLAWGDGEVSEKFPETIATIPVGDALKFTERRDGGVEIVPIAKPSLPECKVKCGTCKGILLARNETETRYFAIVNATASNRIVRLSPPCLGDGVRAELRIGGLVRVSRPKVKLTPKQLLDLMVTDATAAEGGGDPEKLDFIPFFSPDAKPAPNFARRYLANPDQVVGFPGAIPLGPGEGCVVMLRLMTAAAAPGARCGEMRAGETVSPVTIEICDIVLPDPPTWIFAWGGYTSQFPFESRTRFEMDARRMAELGVSADQYLPEEGTKSRIFESLRRNAFHVSFGWCHSGTFGSVYCATNGQRLTAAQVAHIENGAHRVVERARALGLDPSRYAVDLPDEPGRRNAAIVGEMARAVKEAEPSLQVFIDPCFWEGGGFPPEQSILDCLKPYYNEIVDVSVPIRNLVRPTNALTKELWTAKRRVNAQYIHPAARAGRSIAWSSFENGMDGFAYYCYYSPRGNPWDIRTWRELNYAYQMVFPLENDVAITPIYETMREAWEDYRLLTALRETGKTDLLAELVASYAGATDYADIENIPNRSNFQALRDKALEAFKK